MYACIQPFPKMLRFKVPGRAAHVLTNSMSVVYCVLRARSSLASTIRFIYQQRSLSRRLFRIHPLLPHQDVRRHHSPPVAARPRRQPAAVAHTPLVRMVPRTRLRAPPPLPPFRANCTTSLCPFSQSTMPSTLVSPSTGSFLIG